MPEEKKVLIAAAASGAAVPVIRSKTCQPKPSARSLTALADPRRMQSGGRIS